MANAERECPATWASAATAQALADVVVDGVKGSHKVLIPNSSHFPQIDNPKDLSAAVAKFLG